MRLESSRIRFRQEGGGIVVLVSVAMVALFGFAALSIDVAHLYQQQRDVQSATDAGALAAAALLIANPSTSGPIVTEAQNLAQANGVSSNEIAVSTTGAVQAGQWNGTNFTAGTTPYNAVRVPAKRAVNFFFGPVVGTMQKFTEVHSIAALSYPSQAVNLAPFILRQSFVTANGYGVPFGISHNTYKSTGDDGPLSLPGSTGTLKEQMTSGCGCTVNIGDVVSEVNGNSNSYDLLKAADNTTVIMPIVTTLGNHTITVTAFALVAISNVAGNNGQWSATFTIEKGLVGSGTGGPAGFPFAQDRTLVQ